MKFNVVVYPGNNVTSADCRELGAYGEGNSMTEAVGSVRGAIITKLGKLRADGL